MAKKKKAKAFKTVDVISKELDVVDNFVLRHWKRYLYIAIGIVVLIGVILLLSDYHRGLSLKSAGEIENASGITNLQNVIKKYPDAELTRYACLRLAALYVKQKKYEDALNIYKKLADGNVSDYVVAMSKLNEAYTIEKQGNKQKAATLFADLSKEPVPLIIKCQSEYAAGRIYSELGKSDQARPLLKQCASVSHDECSGWPELASDLLSRIK